MTVTATARVSAPWPAPRPFTWDTSSRAVLHDALSRIPRGSWTAEPQEHGIAIFEVPVRSHSDPLGFGRLLACGTALATAWTVLRVLGHDVVAEFSEDPDRPDQVVILRAVGASPPTGRDWAQYTALRRLTGPIPGVPRTPVSTAVLDTIAAADIWPETELAVTRPGCASTAADLLSEFAGESLLVVTRCFD